MISKSTMLAGHPGLLADVQVNQFSAPEPSTRAMMTLGFAGIGFVAFARGRKRAPATA